MVSKTFFARLGVVLLVSVGWAAAQRGHAQAAASDLKARPDKQSHQREEQNRQLQELKNRLDTASAAPAAPADKPAAPAPPPAPNPVETYLKEHPGAGMPNGVQVGYTPQGYYIRSAPNPD